MSGGCNEAKKFQIIIVQFFIAIHASWACIRRRLLWRFEEFL